MKLKKVMSIVLAVFMLLAVAGCSTNPKTHTKKFKDIRGKWTLDSRYFDTKSKKINKQTKTDIEISDSEIKETYKDKKGKVTEKTYSVSGISEGAFTLSKDGTSYEYEFNYDPGTEIIHLYYKSGGKLVHEVYTEYKEKLVTTKDKEKARQGTDAEKEK